MRRRLSSATFWSRVRVAAALGLALLSADAFGEGLSNGGNARIVFVGDSITGQSRNNSKGFANVMEEAVRATYPGCEPQLISLGGSGQSIASWMSVEEQSRTRETFLDVKGIDAKTELGKPADVLVVMLGMNDVLAPYVDGSDESLDRWIADYEKLLDRLQERAQPKVLALAGITPCTEDLSSPKNRLIARMNEKVRALAEQKHALFIQTSEKSQEVLRQGRDRSPEFHITGDYVHPNEAGHLAIATAMFEGMGEAQAAQWLADHKLNPLMEAVAKKGSGISWEMLSATREPGSRNFVFQMRCHAGGAKEVVKITPPAGWKAIPESIEGGFGEFQLIGNPDRLNNAFSLSSGQAEASGQIPAPWLVTAGVPSSWDAENFDPARNETGLEDLIKAGQDVTAGVSAKGNVDWKPYFASVNFTGSSDPNSVDFAAITHAATFESGYAVRWIYSDKDRPVQVRMKSGIFAGNIHLGVWLNGAEIYQGLILKESNGSKSVAGELKRGWNALVFRASHRAWLWQAAVGLVATDGDSLDDLRFSLDFPNPV